MTELGFQSRLLCLQPALPFPQPPAIRHHFQITPESSALASFPQSLLLPQVSASVVTSLEKLTLPEPSRTPFLLLNPYAFTIKDFASFLVPVQCLLLLNLKFHELVGLGPALRMCYFCTPPKSQHPALLLSGKKLLLCRMSPQGEGCLCHPWKWVNPGPRAGAPGILILFILSSRGPLVETQVRNCSVPSLNS